MPDNTILSLKPLVGERVPGESNKAIQALNDYLRAGPGRSLRTLEQRYRESEQRLAPTLSVGTLNNWSARYNWQARAEAFDAKIEQEKNERRRAVMESGFALDYERARALKDLVAYLLGEINEKNRAGEHPKVWLQDVKQIGAGEEMERVDIVRFNSGLIEQLRGALDDLAKETGGRKQRSVTETIEIDYDRLSDDQLQRIANGEDPLQVILREYTRSPS